MIAGIRSWIFATSFVRLHGDGAEGALPLSRRIAPVFPDAGNAEGLPVLHCKLIETALSLFVEGVHRNDATALPESVLEHRLFSD
jgi:hypothetical protein